jgi:hypothetical protein
VYKNKNKNKNKNFLLSNRGPTRGKVITVIHKQKTLKNKNINIVRYNEQNCP